MNKILWTLIILLGIVLSIFFIKIVLDSDEEGKENSNGEGNGNCKVQCIGDGPGEWVGQTYCECYDEETDTQSSGGTK